MWKPDHKLTISGSQGIEFLPWTFWKQCHEDFPGKCKSTSAKQSRRPDLYRRVVMQEPHSTGSFPALLYLSFS